MTADVEKIEQALRDVITDAEVSRGFSWENRYYANPAISSCDRLFIARYSPKNIRALLDELSRLREALEPFAREALEWADYDETENLVESWPGGPSSQIRVCHLRAAARALSERKGQDG